jgi:Protein of unknown function (DUF1161)
MTKRPVLVLALLAPAAWAADICEPLREHIEVRIAASGGSGFAVIVADAETPVEGKVVGTCAQGSRKLVYVRGDKVGVASAARSSVQPAAQRVASAPRAPADNGGVLTECRDGRVLRGHASCGP